MYDKSNLKTNIQDNKNLVLIKALSIFKYDNLPDSIHENILERYLLLKGLVAFVKINDVIYSLPCSVTEKNQYDEPIKVTVSNAYLKYSETLTVGKDCVLGTNDSIGSNLNALFDKYSYLISVNETTMALIDIIKRSQILMSASDDNTIESAHDYLDNLENGELGVISTNQILDDLHVKTQTAGTQSASLTDLFQYQNYLKSELLTELGIVSNNNMKRERLNTQEVSVNQNVAYPLISNMLLNRQKFVDKLNELFGLDITVDYSDLWKNQYNSIINDTDPESSSDTDPDNDEHQDDNSEDEQSEDEQSEDEDKKHDDKKVGK